MTLFAKFAKLKLKEEAGRVFSQKKIAEQIRYLRRDASVDDPNKKWFIDFTFDKNR